MGHYREKGPKPTLVSKEISFESTKVVGSKVEMESQKNFEELTCLVQELSKSNPCQKTVRFYMDRFHLPYSEDSLESLQTVLQAMYQETR